MKILSGFKYGRAVVSKSVNTLVTFRWVVYYSGLRASLYKLYLPTTLSLPNTTLITNSNVQYFSSIVHYNNKQLNKQTKGSYLW